ncbi:uncharacterized protein [Littorina saxatilis]|uniref:Uncharacterized protein n=1 Tax=Littorina saxatilis TaxID=31220 RepID=A0AAN9G9E8_9CAEN
MWTYHAHLLFVVCLCPVFHTEVASIQCEGEELLLIQETCRQPNAALLAAEKDHNDTMVCKSLFELWKCVAGNVPGCFHAFTTLYKSYFHSPHNCNLSPQQIMMLQNLTRQTAEEEGEGEVDPEVDVDIVPLPSGPSTPVDVSSSSSSKEDDGGGGGEVDSVTTGDNTKGGSHKQTGNDASISRQCGLPMVVSWLVTFKMTSYLLHS